MFDIHSMIRVLRRAYIDRKVPEAMDVVIVGDKPASGYMGIITNIVGNCGPPLAIIQRFKVRGAIQIPYLSIAGEDIR